MAVVLYKPYTTLNKVKKECQYKITDTVNDDWFKEVINDASRYVEEHTHRDFWYHDHASVKLTVKAAWVQGDIIYVPWPIVTLTVVEITDSEATSVLDSDDWAFEAQDIKKGSSRIFRATGLYWSTAVGNRDGAAQPDPTQVTIQLTGTFGYSITNTATPPSDVPSGVTRATTLIAAALSGLNRKQFTPLDGVPVEFTEYRIPEEAKKLLAAYSRLIL